MVSSREIAWHAPPGAPLIEGARMHIDLSPRGQLVAFFILACAFGWVLYPILDAGSAANIPIAPLLAALVVIPLTRGRAGLREWAARCVRWRAPLRWNVLAIGFSLVALPLAAYATVQLGAPAPGAEALREWTLIPLTFVVMFVLVGIGEEWGWTGFALPELMRLGPWTRQVGILAVARTVWHLPLLLTGQLPWSVFVLILGAQYLWATAYRRAGGVVMIVAVWHASLNSVGGEFLTPMFTGPDAMTFAALWVLAYVALIAVVLYLDRAALRRGAMVAEA